mmetsp:Transcript_45169/g.139353  ORF Transcript_45169/g.139353 Transcript_45169/m.139353 type:complete len:458 (-) Transcript_45169:310-1683(-)
MPQAGARKSSPPGKPKGARGDASTTTPIDFGTENDSVIGRLRDAMGSSPPVDTALSPPPASDAARDRSPDAMLHSPPTAPATQPTRKDANDSDGEDDENLLTRIVRFATGNEPDDDDGASAGGDRRKESLTERPSEKSPAMGGASAPAIDGGNAAPSGGSFFGPSAFGSSTHRHPVSPGTGGQALPSGTGPQVSPGASATSNLWGSSLPAYPGPPNNSLAGPHHGTPGASGAPFNPSATPFRSAGGSPLAAGQFSQPPGGQPPPPQYGTPIHSGQPAADPSPPSGASNQHNVLVRNSHGVFLLSLANQSPVQTGAPPPAAVPSGSHHGHHHGQQHPQGAGRGGSGGRGGGYRGGRGGHHGSQQQRSPLPASTEAPGNSTVGGSPAPGASVGHSPPPPMCMPPSMQDAQAAAAAAAGRTDPATRLPSGEPTFARTRRSGSNAAHNNGNVSTPGKDASR